ncbi:MAG TPA: hypothetical protein VFU15_10295, partial [Bacteroidia bacterium]|nr:hypothetical protein [Bacteroidia bacterium]
YSEQQNKVLQSMTKPEVDALAKKWLDTSHMVIMVVGDSAKIAPGLAKLGYEVVNVDDNGNAVKPAVKDVKSAGQVNQVPANSGDKKKKKKKSKKDLKLQNQ